LVELSERSAIRVVDLKGLRGIVKTDVT